MTGALLEARGLAIAYGRRTVVSGLDFALQEGTITAITGPPGSGKTSILLVFLGLLAPAAGSIAVLDRDPFRQPVGVRRQLAFIPEDGGFERHLSARDNLIYGARLAGQHSIVARRAVDEALAWAGLDGFAGRPAGMLRAAERQRLCLADIWLRGSRLALIDAPAAGLEEPDVAAYCRLLTSLRDRGVTVLTTMESVDPLAGSCDRIAVLGSSGIALDDAPAALARRLAGGTTVTVVSADDIDLRSTLGGLGRFVDTHDVGTAEIIADRDLRPEIANRVVGAGGRLRSLVLNKVSLEGVLADWRKGLVRAA
jgi:ABC-2 type transport system ATP-binding protein